MTTNKKLLTVALVCAIAAAGIYGFALWKEHQVSPIDMTGRGDAPMGKVAASKIEDGTYTVQVRSIMSTPEDTVVSFSHVTYFEGDEAKASAEHEVSCDSQPIESCVPTLTRGYYVRMSGTSAFMAPLTRSTIITLKDKSGATSDDLRNLNREFEPVFDVMIEGGNVVSITERSPIQARKG